MAELLTDDEYLLLDAVTCVQEWDSALAVIRDTRDGNFPDDWFSRVVKSGMAHRIFKRWGGTPQLALPGLE